MCRQMEFSAPMRCRQVAVSPDGAYMATTLGVRLSVFSVTTQEEVVHFACLDDPQVRLLISRNTVI